jgi:hypothetical protein
MTLKELAKDRLNDINHRKRVDDFVNEFFPVFCNYTISWTREFNEALCMKIVEEEEFVVRKELNVHGRESIMRFKPIGNEGFEELSIRLSSYFNCHIVIEFDYDKYNAVLQSDATLFQIVVVISKRNVS